ASARSVASSASAASLTASGCPPKGRIGPEKPDSRVGGARHRARAPRDGLPSDSLGKHPIDPCPTAGPSGAPKPAIDPSSSFGPPLARPNRGPQGSPSSSPYCRRKCERWSRARRVLPNFGVEPVEFKTGFHGSIHTYADG